VPTPPAVDTTPALGGPRQNIAMTFSVEKLEMVWLPDGEKSLRIRLLVLTEVMNVTDRRTCTT